MYTAQLTVCISPNLQVLRPYVGEMMKVMLHVLNTDNEDNALISLKIIFDLHKNYHQFLAGEVGPFVGFLVHLYRSLPRTISVHFNKPVTFVLLVLLVDLILLSRHIVSCMQRLCSFVLRHVVWWWRAGFEPRSGGFRCTPDTKKR